jgi:hypothetical protein
MEGKIIELKTLIPLAGIQRARLIKAETDARLTTAQSVPTKIPS